MVSSCESWNLKYWEPSAVVSLKIFDNLITQILHLGILQHLMQVHKSRICIVMPSDPCLNFTSSCLLQMPLSELFSVSKVALNVIIEWVGVLIYNFVLLWKKTTTTITATKIAGFPTIMFEPMMQVNTFSYWSIGNSVEDAFEMV